MPRSIHASPFSHLTLLAALLAACGAESDGSQPTGTTRADARSASYPPPVVVAPVERPTPMPGAVANELAGAGGSAMASGSGGGAGALTGTSGAAGSSPAGSSSGGAAGSSGGPLDAAGGNAGSAAGGVCDAITSVLSPKCGAAGCHGGAIGNFAVGLDEARAFVGTDAIVNTGCGVFIDPDDPAQSLILTKTNGDARCGQPMPLGGPPLSSEELDCIADWLTQF